MAVEDHVLEKKPINLSLTLKYFKYFNIYKHNLIRIQNRIQPVPYYIIVLCCRQLNLVTEHLMQEADIWAPGHHYTTSRTGWFPSAILVALNNPTQAEAKALHGDGQ